MPLSLEIDIKLCQNYTKAHIHMWDKVYELKFLTDHIQQIWNMSTRT